MPHAPTPQFLFCTSSPGQSAPGFGVQWPLESGQPVKLVSKEAKHEDGSNFKLGY